MELLVQFELKKDARYIEYLRMHSYWYKLLRRNPNAIFDFKKEFSTYIKSEKLIKLDTTLKYIEMMENIFSSTK